MGAADTVKFSKVVKLLQKYGFKLARQNGSHKIFTKPGCPDIITLAPHGKEIKFYAVKQIGQVLNLSEQEFLKKIKKIK